MEKCRYLHPSMVCFEPNGLFLIIFNNRTAIPKHIHQYWTQWTPSILFHPPRPNTKASNTRVLTSGGKPIALNCHLNKVCKLKQGQMERKSSLCQWLSPHFSKDSISVRETEGTCSPLRSAHLHNREGNDHARSNSNHLGGDSRL